jgi:HEAT repeat protein
LAAEKLGKLGDPRAVAPLVRALTDPDRGVRQAVVVALGKLGEKRAVRPLASALKDKDPYVRINAAYALGKLGDRQVAGILKQAVSGFLQGGAWVDEFRAAVTWSLGRLGDPQASAMALQALRDFHGIDSDRRRARAAERLAELGGTDAIKALVRALSDPSSLVRLKAASALRKLGIGKWSQWIKGKNYDDYLCLADSGDTESLGILVAALQTEPASTDINQGKYEKAQVAAAEALGQLGNDGAIAPLIRVLGDRRPRKRSVRSAAALALGTLGGQRAFQALTSFLESETYSDVRRAASQALAQCDVGPSSTRRSEPEAKGQDPAIGTEKHDGAEVLAKALGSSDGDVRRSAALSLAKAGHGKWQGWIKGNSSDFRRLGESGDSEVLEPLVAALAWGSVDAIEALAILGDSRALTPLIQKLSDPSGDIRIAAADALARLGDSHWQQFVKGVDVDDFARLGQAGHAGAIAQLITSLEAVARDERVRAAKALVGLANNHPSLLKEQWGTVQSKITRKHDDGPAHMDEKIPSSCGAPTHVDKAAGRHADIGIGLDFPKSAAATGSNESSTFEVTCPNPECGIKLRVPAKFAGRKGKCQKCGCRFEIPEQAKKDDEIDLTPLDF